MIWFTAALSLSPGQRFGPYEIAAPLGTSTIVVATNATASRGVKEREADGPPR